ncbi:MAG: hypothetical protein AVDCRST_MAG33-2034, partial [uncultured Thermomicrobiales bacterium]
MAVVARARPLDVDAPARVLSRRMTWNG